jgi:hypothetical protein
MWVSLIYHNHVNLSENENHLVTKSSRLSLKDSFRWSFNPSAAGGVVVTPFTATLGAPFNNFSVALLPLAAANLLLLRVCRLFDGEIGTTFLDLDFLPGLALETGTWVAPFVVVVFADVPRMKLSFLMASKSSGTGGARERHMSAIERRFKISELNTLLNTGHWLALKVAGYIYMYRPSGTPSWLRRLLLQRETGGLLEHFGRRGLLYEDLLFLALTGRSHWHACSTRID